MSEMDVFAATLKWVMYDPARQQYIRKLMERIRFPLMPPRDLMVHVNVVDFMRTKCNDLLLEASSYHMLPHSQPIVPSSRTRVRSNDSRLVVVGGADNTDEVSNQLKGMWVILKVILTILVGIISQIYCYTHPLKSFFFVNFLNFFDKKKLKTCNL
jgi:hypothetical protein